MNGKIWYTKNIRQNKQRAKNVEFCDILIANHRKAYGEYRYH